MSSRRKVSEEIKSIYETDSSDIIECSIIENVPNNKLRNEILLNENLSKKKTVSSKKKVSKTSETYSKPIGEAIRLSLKKNFQLLPKSESDSKEVKICEDEISLKTPVSVRNPNSNSCEKRQLSTLKKNSEDLPYISRTKMRNVERWLQQNDVEIIRTPPFANLSVTPVSTGKKRCTKSIRKRNEAKEKLFIDDSDVEGVLKAVYGSDWIEKNVTVRAKTEPKLKMNNNRTPTKIPVNGKITLTCSFKRNLLRFDEGEKKKGKAEKNLNLDDSLLSGIELINLDESKSSIQSPCGSNSSERRIITRGKLCRDTIKAVEKKKIDSDWFDEEANTKKKGASTKKQTLKNDKDPVVGVFGSACKTKKKTFLASLSVSTPTSRSHPDADYYKLNFKSKKDELVQKLFKLYNGEVFEEKLPVDMNFSWNVKLRGTAGFCYNKRITKSTGEILRVSRIEFSTKIVDRADRLRDTMIHELCHAASWIVNGTLDGHGAIWSSWAAKAVHRFPELPEIRRCHNYDIMAKYTYRCTVCGYSIKRHSKSINLERKRCGHCFGTLELLLNKKRKGKTEVPEFDATRTLRTPNKFAIFVKENYRSVKNLNANVKHADIMKILSEQYALAKTENDIS